MQLTIASVVQGPFQVGAIVTGQRSGFAGTVVSHVGSILTLTVDSDTGFGFQIGETISATIGGTFAVVSYTAEIGETVDGTFPGAGVGITPEAGPGSVIVENGEGLPDANSYISIADASGYLLTYRNQEAWSNANEQQQGTALRVATQWLDTRFGDRWVGQRLTAIQALDWPRSDAFDAASRRIVGVPIRLAQATAEMAVRYLEDPASLAPDVGAAEAGAILSQTNTVGPISQSISYQGASSVNEKVFQLVERMVRTGGLVFSGSFARR